MKTATEMAAEAGAYWEHDWEHGDWNLATSVHFSEEDLEKFAELVRADERERVTNMLLYLHNKAAPYHNYYKHAAVELNRKAGEGEKI